MNVYNVMIINESGVETKVGEYKSERVARGVVNDLNVHDYSARMHVTPSKQQAQVSKVRANLEKFKKPSAKELAAIVAAALEHTSLETLETRKSDVLDFHDLSVWEIKAALLAAFEAGRASK